MPEGLYGAMRSMSHCVCLKTMGRHSCARSVDPFGAASSRQLIYDPRLQ
jgi:hypothetical protein